MVYSTVTGVKAYFGNPSWSVSTTPTEAQVTNWCEEAAAIVDSYIANTVTVPVTDATDLKVITAISDLYVIDNISFVMGKNRIMMQSGSENVPRSVSHAQFYKRLEMIKNGETLLINSASSAKSKVFSGANSNSLEFVSKKDTQQW